MIVRFVPGVRDARLGHFVLVTSFEDCGPLIVDPITGLSEVRGWRSFSDAWSGHCILPAASTLSVPPGTILVGTLLLCALLVAAAKTGKKRRSRVAVLVMVLLPTGRLSATDTIRNHDRDGTNAAILFAAMIDPDLKGCVRQLSAVQPMGGLSMLALQQALEELSVSARVRRLRFSDLVALQEPAIVLLRRDGTGRSQYGIVLAASDDRVTVLHTGAVVVQELSEDDFRTAWSGHAIVADPRPDRFVLSACGLLGGMLGLGFVRTRGWSTAALRNCFSIRRR